MTAPGSAPIARAGVVLAVLQFAFALTWVVYASYLPALAAQVGVPASAVPWILLVDQAIFLVCDWLAGVLADRIGDAVARLGRLIALITLASCAALLALPLVAPLGSAALLGALMVVWSATSSMLRAPPLALAGRHAARSQRAWLAGLYTLGLAAAGAVAPYLGRALAAIDPRVAFALTTGIVAAITIVLAALPHGAPAAPSAPSAPPGRPGALAVFVAGFALLALGAQIATAINAAPLLLRHAARDRLGDLLPVFWIACAVATLPAAAVIRRAGALIALAACAVIGAAALAIAALGDSLAAVVAAHAVAGLAWGGIVSAALAASTALDRRAGSITGLVFSALAAATLARIALVASGAAAAHAAALPILAPAVWAVAALAIGGLAARRPGGYGT